VLLCCVLLLMAGALQVAECSAWQVCSSPCAAVCLGFLVLVVPLCAWCSACLAVSFPMMAGLWVAGAFFVSWCCCMLCVLFTLAVNMMAGALSGVPALAECSSFRVLLVCLTALHACCVVGARGSAAWCEVLCMLLPGALRAGVLCVVLHVLLLLWAQCSACLVLLYACVLFMLCAAHVVLGALSMLECSA
jgi:hypothetical protein